MTGAVFALKFKHQLLTCGRQLQDILDVQKLGYEIILASVRPNVLLAHSGDDIAFARMVPSSFCYGSCINL